MAAVPARSLPLRELTVLGAVEAFVARKLSLGRWAEATQQRTGHDLRRFAALGPDEPIGAVDAEWLVAYLAAMHRDGLALASQRSRFYAVVEWLAWCERKGMIERSPFRSFDLDDLPWTGRSREDVGAGKTQLANGEEARAYLRACRQLDKPRERVAAALPLLTGLRSGELRHLRVQDVDFVLDRIWIRTKKDAAGKIVWRVKTARSSRTVGLPPELVADLRELCDGREGLQWLFASRRNRAIAGGPFEDRWLNRLVKRVCQLARVTVICAHGLRDTYASILVQHAGMGAPDVARLLGHADGGRTARQHYIGAAEHSSHLRLVKA